MLVYLSVIWYILWPYGIFLTIWLTSGDLVYFYTLWYIESRKIWQPWSRKHFVSNSTLYSETYSDIFDQVAGSTWPF
jgi:hypothetical protein